MNYAKHDLSGNNSHEIFSTARKRNKTFELLSQNSCWIIRWNYLSRYLSERAFYSSLSLEKSWLECVIFRQMSFRDFHFNCYIDVNPMLRGYIYKKKKKIYLELENKHL